MLTALIILGIIILVLMVSSPQEVNSAEMCRCEVCGSTDTKRSWRWTRGWNNLCNQAYGDDGWYCNNCSHVTFKTSLEEHLKTLPEWCKPYR